MSEKGSPRNMARIFDRIEQPIYFVDRHWSIRYCNRACLEWLGCSRDDILDRRCAFHSGANLDPGDALAAGLCPPPGTMESGENIGIVMCLQPTGQLKRRRARFLTFSTHSGPVGILAVVSHQDLPDSLEPAQLFESAASIEQSHSEADAREAFQLHEELRQNWSTAHSAGWLPILVGSTPVVRRLRQQMEAATKVTCNVCLLAPPGGGGVALARSIYYGSNPHPQQCLIPLPCDELDPGILRMTIHAFDSAPVPPPEYPHTLLLENVDRLPGVSQEVLCEILSSKSRTYRILSTCDQPLDQLVEKGTFLPQLFQLATHFTIVVPSLRERRDDIPLVAQAVLEDLNRKGPKQVLGFSREVLDLFVQYDWPRNLEELTWVIDRAYQTTVQPVINVDALPREIRWSMERKMRLLRDPEKISLPEFLAEVEKELLLRALQRARGNKTRAAKMLGLSRPRLYRRLLQHKLIQPEDLQEE